VALLDADGTTVASTTTDGTGVYGFAGVPVGWYQTQVTVPAGTTASPRYQGPSSDADSDIDTGGLSGLFHVRADELATGEDAGVIPGVLGGRVWEDTDGNGVMDGAEGGLAGITVQLLDAAGLVVATTTTADAGTYLFTYVAAGQYRLKFVGPSGYTFTQPDQGSDESSDSDVTDLVAGTTDLFALAGGQNLNVSAGLIAP
jgi:hypothetical protein